MSNYAPTERGRKDAERVKTHITLMGLTLKNLKIIQVTLISLSASPQAMAMINNSKIERVTEMGI